jgi:hypothetical protein
MNASLRLWAACVASASGLIAACSTAPATPAPTIPDNLQAPAGERLLEVVGARGVQIYECRAKAGAAGAAGADWMFVAPEAELVDAQGRVLGKHYAGPHWEALDGSRVKGSVKAKADAPQAGAIPWLLLATDSVGPAGRYAGITSIQRVQTVGGLAPTTGCSATDLGRQARVPYTADYRLFVKA